MSHTPGPWKVGKHKTTVVSEQKVDVTPAPNLIGHDGGVNEVEHYGGSLIAESILRHENVNLITAAPDMYNALNNLIKWYDDNFPSASCSEISDIVFTARIALDKANGKL
ncbi:hypothetical protein ACFU1R_06470 [Priestia megaterium]|uniref:hypothetical protein n=1 Tax=Priestia megaterium TaxID=1404 RepID=UPI003672D834